MQNLTKKQMEIIEDLKNQFAEINVCREVSSSNPLLVYANEFESIKQSENAERDIILAKNNAILKARDYRIKEDFVYLAKLLAEVDDNINIELNNHHISRQDIEISFQNISLYIHYYINYLDNISYKYANNIDVIDSIRLEYKGIEYPNVQEIIKSDDFAKSFKQLLNRINNN